LQEAADAADSAELGDIGKHAALHLRAAIGAFVEFSKSPQGPTELMFLEVTVKSMLGTALHSLYGALAILYRDLAQEEHDRQRECRELSRLWSTLQRSVARGEPIRPAVFRKLENLRAKLEEA
jgi:hypothetical protein